MESKLYPKKQQCSEYEIRRKGKKKNMNFKPPQKPRKYRKRGKKGKDKSKQIVASKNKMMMMKEKKKKEGERRKEVL